jgi:hypothetical protein
VGDASMALFQASVVITIGSGDGVLFWEDAWIGGLTARLHRASPPGDDRWFEADHDARRQSIEAHLEAIDDDDVDYEEWEAAMITEALVKQDAGEDEELDWSVYPTTDEEEEYMGYQFPTP